MSSGGSDPGPDTGPNIQTPLESHDASDIEAFLATQQGKALDPDAQNFLKGTQPGIFNSTEGVQVIGANGELIPQLAAASGTSAFNAWLNTRNASNANYGQYKADAAAQPGRDAMILTGAAAPPQASLSVLSGAKPGQFSGRTGGGYGGR